MSEIFFFFFYKYEQISCPLRAYSGHKKEINFFFFLFSLLLPQKWNWPFVLFFFFFFSPCLLSFCQLAASLPSAAPLGSMCTVPAADYMAHASWVSGCWNQVSYSHHLHHCLCWKYFPFMPYDPTGSVSLAGKWRGDRYSQFVCFFLYFISFFILHFFFFFLLSSKHFIVKMFHYLS